MWIAGSATQPSSRGWRRGQRAVGAVESGRRPSRMTVAPRKLTTKKGSPLRSYSRRAGHWERSKTRASGRPVWSRTRAPAHFGEDKPSAAGRCLSGPRRPALADLLPACPGSGRRGMRDAAPCSPQYEGVEARLGEVGLDGSPQRRCWRRTGRCGAGSTVRAEATSPWSAVRRRIRPRTSCCRPARPRRRD